MKDLMLKFIEHDQAIEKLNKQVAKLGRKIKFKGLVDILQNAAILTEFFAILGIVEELKSQGEVVIKSKNIF